METTRKVAAVMAVTGALMLSGCPSAELAPCQTLPSVQGGYVVKLVRQGPAPAGCTDAETPAEFSDVWAFDTVTDRNIVGSSVALPLPDTGPIPQNRLFQGQFTQERSDANNSCTIPALSTISDTVGGAVLSYKVTDMTFLSGAAYQGAEFKAVVVFTRGTCAATYDALALSPAVACQTNHDCDPFKTPFSSGIFSVFDQGCHLAANEPWTAGAVAFLGNAPGVCFLNQAYPSLGKFTP